MNLMNTGLFIYFPGQNINFKVFDGQDIYFKTASLPPLHLRINCSSPNKNNGPVSTIPQKYRLPY